MLAREWEKDKEKDEDFKKSERSIFFFFFFFFKAFYLSLTEIFHIHTLDLKFFKN